MSTEKQFEKQVEHLKVVCLEALELKAKKLDITSERINSQVKLWKSLAPSNMPVMEFSRFYLKYTKELLSSERKWLVGLGCTVLGLDLSYAFELAEDVDPDLATIILYRIYRCIETSETLSESEVEPIRKKSLGLKSIIEGTDPSGIPAGPAGIAFQNILNNAGPIISQLLPSIQKIMGGDGFKKIMENAVPTNADPNAPPDIESIVKGTITALQSPEGQEIFSQVGGIVSSVQGVKM